MEFLYLSKEFKTDDVTLMNRTFFYSRNLKLFNIEGFNTKNVVDIDYMFSYCKIGEQIFNCFNIQKVKEIFKKFFYNFSFLI